MKITGITVQNFLGIPDLRHTMKAPLLLVAGGNGRGKSSLIDAIRFGLTGLMPRGVSARGEGRKSVVSDGAKAGFVEIQTDGFTTKRAIVSGKVTGDDPQMPEFLSLALDPAAFAALPEDGRRRMLFELMGVKADRDTVVAQMTDAEVPERIIEEVFPILRGGFAEAVKFARDKAVEHRAVWRSITGENYGSLKAETWEPELPSEVPTDAEIAGVEQHIAEARERVEALAALSGRVAAALLPSRKLQLEGEAADGEAAQAALEEAEGSLSLARLDLDHVKNTWPGGQPCPHCQTRLLLKDGKLEEAPPSSQTREQAEKALAAAKQAVEDAERAVANARGRVSSAAGAKRSLETATIVSDKERAQLEELPEARRALELHQTAHATLLQNRHIHEQAGMKGAKAKSEHRNAVAWTTVQGLCEPDGIPAVLLSRALDPLNASMAAEAAQVFSATAQVERDLTLTYGGRPYALCSESEQWRADALFGLEIARRTDSRVLVLDRWDVIQVHERNDILDWLTYLTNDRDALDTVVLAGTLVNEPKGDELLDVIWLGSNKPVEAAREAA